MAIYELTHDAIEDTLDIQEYVREYSPRQATLIGFEFFRTFELLQGTPTMGRIERPSFPNTRIWIGQGKLKSYKIRYVIQGENILVFQIIHSARSDQALRLPPKS